MRSHSTTIHKGRNAGSVATQNQEDVLAAYSKEDFTEMMSIFAIHDTEAVKSMVDKGKFVGLRKGSEVYLESIDLIARFAQVRPKRSNTTVWIPSDFVD